MKEKKRIEEEIELPEGTSVKIDKGFVEVKGKKGEVKKMLVYPDITIEANGNKVAIKARRFTKKEKKIVGSFKAHIRNMVKGANEGCIYKLKICSGHFPINVSVDGSKFVVKNFLGEKIPRVLKIKPGAAVKVEGDIVTVEGLDKDLTSQVAADIELLTRRAGYDSRVFQDGIFIINKNGKEIK